MSFKMSLIFTRPIWKLIFVLFNFKEYIYDVELNEMSHWCYIFINRIVVIPNNLFWFNEFLKECLSIERVKVFLSLNDGSLKLTRRVSKVVLFLRLVSSPTIASWRSRCWKSYLEGKLKVESFHFSLSLYPFKTGEKVWEWKKFWILCMLKLSLFLSLNF